MTTCNYQTAVVRNLTKRLYRLCCERDNKMAPAEPNHKPFEIKGEEPNFAEEREGWKGYIEWEKVRSWRGGKREGRC